MSTTVHITLSDQLQQTLSKTTGGTVYAWAVYFNNGTAYYQPLLSSSAAPFESATSITLPTLYNGGKLYFVMQSVDTAQTITPLFPPGTGTSTTFSESDLSWQNAKAGNYRYDSYELSLLGQSGDSGNLTSVDAFAIPMSIDITYPNGAPEQTRGYAINGGSVFSDIRTAFPNGGSLVQDFSVGPLAGTPRMAAAPGQSGPDGLSGVASAADWYAYVEAVGNNLAGSVQVAGQFNGAGSQEYVVGQPISTGSYIEYHNPGFYSYSVTYTKSPATVYSGSETLGSNPFASNPNSNAITVTDPNAGTYKIGTTVSIQGATAFSVFTAAQLNTTQTITNVIDSGHYQFVVQSAPPAGPTVVSGGGNSIVSSVPLATNPFSATQGDQFFTVTDANASAFANIGVEVTFSGATAFSGFTADYLNGTTFTITQIIDETHYQVGSTAVTQTAVGGGATAAPTYVRPEAGTFVFKPAGNSQVQGDISISSVDLANSIYQTLGNTEVLVNNTATPYQFTAFQNINGVNTGVATNLMNTGANTEWGAFYVKLLTGFIGGYYGATGAVSNPYVGVPSPINLNQNWNFDPTYAFDSSKTTPFSWDAATYGTGVQYDKYANIFFTNSNSYGNGYSDAVMSLFQQGGPLIPNAYAVLLPTNPFTTTSGSNLVTVSDPNTTAYGYKAGDLVSFAGAGTVNGVNMGQGFPIAPGFFAFTIQSVDTTTNTYVVQAVQNATAGPPGGGNAVVAGYDVPNVNITLYDNGETPSGQQTLAQHQLYTPTAIYNTSSGPFVLSGQGATGSLDMTFGLGLSQMRPRDDLTVTVSLGFYAGMEGANAKFNYVPFNTSTSVSLFQHWNYNGTAFAAAGAAAASGTGFTINDLPFAAGWNWYQLVFADTQSGISRTYNMYLKATQAGILNPNYVAPGVNQAGDIAIDGLATFTGGDITHQTITNLTFNMFNGGTLSMDPSLLEQITDPTVMQANKGVWIPPTAPIVGTESGGLFTAAQASPSTGKPNPTGTVQVTGSGDLAFGWFGADSTFLQQAVAAGQGSVFSAYTNKIGGLNTAQITYSGTAAGTLTATADIDGKWVVDASDLSNGTYAAYLTEFNDGVAVNNPGASVSFNFSLSQLSFANTVGSNYLQLAAGGASGNWIQLQTSSSNLPNGTLMAYATDANGNMLDRDSHAITTDIDRAVLGEIGFVTFDNGTALGGGTQSVYLPVGEQLHFAIQTGDNRIEQLPNVQISGSGSLNVTVSGAFGTFNLSATVNNTLSSDDSLGTSQRSADQAWYYLTNGETMHLEVKGSSYDLNAIHFVRFDVDPTTGAMSVGGVAYGNTDAFRAAVQASWDPNVALGGGRGNYQQSADWTVTQGSGYYAPVLANEKGNIFVIGDANIDGREHVRIYGSTTVGFEDRVGGDFDYNDLVMKISHS